jgi:hypothetical protein
MYLYARNPRRQRMKPRGSDSHVAYIHAAK